MSVKLLTEHHLEFLCLKGGCIGSSESTIATLLEITCHGSCICLWLSGQERVNSSQERVNSGQERVNFVR